MYMTSSFLSPAKVCSDPRTPPRVTKKVPSGYQGRSTTRHLPRSTSQSTPAWTKDDLARAFQLKTKSTLKIMEPVLRQISDDIWASLGPGYSESVYHCAFEVALRNRNIYYETERIVPVFYDGQNVGHVRADLIIDRKVVVELKSVGRLTDGYRIQTKNYLKLLNLETGYLINFPDKIGSLEFEAIDRPQTPLPPIDPIDC